MTSVLNQFRNFSPFLKLLFLLMLSITGMILVTLIGLLIALPFYGADSLSVLTGEYDLSNPVHMALLKYMQIISHFGMFIFPALIFAKIFENGGRKFFLTRNKISVPILLMGGFVIVLMLPVVNFLGDINSGMHLPESMKTLENWMQTTEQTAEKIVLAFISQTEWYALIINLFMIAIVPAVGEELIFRGILQRKLNQWFGNVHVAVFVSAFIFSAIHMQFYGFLPRLFLGMLLGYLFVWTGSLWVPIFAHFVNNGLAVLVAWMNASGFIADDLDSFGNYSDSWGYMLLLSFMAFAVLLFFRYVNKKANPYFSLLRKENT